MPQDIHKHGYPYSTNDALYTMVAKFGPNHHTFFMYITKVNEHYIP